MLLSLVGPAAFDAVAVATAQDIVTADASDALAAAVIVVVVAVVVVVVVVAVAAASAASLENFITLFINTSETQRDNC